MTNKESLLQFGVQGPNPRWSSESLRQYLRDAADCGGGSFDEAIISLVALLGQPDRELTAELAHFIKDFVVLCFTEHREAFESVRWGRVTEALGALHTQPLCYFAALAVPPQHLTGEQTAAIIKRLENTPYRQEIASLATS